MLRLLILILSLVLYATVVAIVLSRSKKRDVVAARLESIEKQDAFGLDESDILARPFSERFIRPGFSRLLRVVENIVPISAKAQKALDENLRRAGMRPSAREYIAKHIVIAAIVCVVLFLLTFNLLYVLIAALGYYVLARFSLARKITQRKEDIENGMPDVLDLLSTSVTAGLGFDQALQHVIVRCKGPLVDELSITQKEITLGVPRGEALQRLANRCDVDPLTTFVSSVAQADRLGIAISNVLMTQAAGIRERHRQKIEEKAAKLPVKILLPMILLILPAMFIILLGPAVPRVMQALGTTAV